MPLERDVSWSTRLTVAHICLSIESTRNPVTTVFLISALTCVLPISNTAAATGSPAQARARLVYLCGAAARRGSTMCRHGRPHRS